MKVPVPMPVPHSHQSPRGSSSTAGPEQPLGSRPYPSTPPQNTDRQHARFRYVNIPEPPLPPYAASLDRCVVLPGREAHWRTKGKGKGGALLSTLAVVVLVSEQQLLGADVEFLQDVDGADRSPTDPLSSIALSTYSTIFEILLGAAEGPRETYRQIAKAKEDAAAREARMYAYSSRPPTPSVLPTTDSHACFTPSDTNTANSDAGATTATARPEVNPYAAVATSTARGVARMVGAGLKAPGVYTRGLARGFNNVPRLYGDDSVREEEKIDGVASGLAAAGKGLGLGLYDGITGFFLEPIRGARRRGPQAS